MDYIMVPLGHESRSLNACSFLIPVVASCNTVAHFRWRFIADSLRAATVKLPVLSPPTYSDLTVVEQSW